MAWAAYHPAPAYDSTRSLRGIRVGTSAFLYNRTDLASTLFVRYDIANTGDEAVHALYVGYGADTDIFLVHDQDQPCRPLDWWANQTGYFAGRGLTYTYVSRHSEDGALPERCYSVVAGYTILDMSSSGNLGGRILAHRIRTRDVNVDYPGFSDPDLEAGLPVLNALKGLTPTGDPMIDPTTNQPTKFAFTGDPVTGTGWIGGRDDVRSLLSLPPIDLAPGETRSMTVAWFFVHGDGLADALDQLKARYDAVVAERGLWDF